MKIMCAIVLLAATSAVIAEVRPQTNAALLYWRAFDLLPRSSDEFDSDVEKLAAAQKIVLDEETASELSFLEDAFDLMIRAAAVPECDWGFSSEDVFSVITHPTRAGELGAYAVLQARLVGAQGEHAEAIELLRATVALGRQVAPGPGMGGAYAQWRIEQLACDAAIDLMPRVPPALLSRLDLLSPDLPPRITPTQWWNDERKLVTSMRNLIAAGKVQELEAYLRMIVTVPDSGRILLDGDSLNLAKIGTMLDEWDREYVTVGELLLLPQDEFATAYHAWVKQLEKRYAENLFLKLMPGSVPRMLAMDREVKAKLDRLQEATRK